VAKDFIIIKIGTGVLTRESDGKLDDSSLVRLVHAVAQLVKSGHHCIMVSSGAVGAGVSALGLDAYPQEVRLRQACAAVGQTRLMHAYENLFREFDLSVAQILLTSDDLDSEKRCSRMKDTLDALIEQGNIIPIMNENDCVATQELRVGDNDMLSARVAKVISAKKLILLTTVDGLMPPEGGDVITQVDDIDDVMSFARDENGKFSIGGMKSKLQAVKFALENGVSTSIANGRNPENLADLIAGKSAGVGTQFNV